jgi:hypothetical protein
MNFSNVIIIISTFLLVCLFIGTVFINLDIKDKKTEIDKLNDSIKILDLKIKRQKIEITTLTNPKFVIDYIERNNLKPVSLKNIETVVIKNN